MIRYSPLLEAREVRIGRFDHPGKEPHCDPALEAGADYSINLVERGRFSLEIGQKRWELSRGDYFVHYPGMEYRCRHGELMPTDVCVSIKYASPTDPSDSVDALERVAREHPVLPSSNRLAYLFRRIESARHEPMAAEETAYEVMAEVIAPLTPVGNAHREHQLHWYAERVDAIRQRLERDYAAEHRLDGLATSVGMSLFHFARIFRELVGMPPHSYLRRIRLREAARRLRDGASVTEACFASGFQNLSHFSRQFYRHFGVKASGYPREVPAKFHPDN